MSRVASCAVFAAVFLLVSGLSGCSSRVKPVQPVPGEAYPYTKLTMLDGTTRILEEFEGRRVAMIFWAEWCPKSRRAVRRFNEFSSNRRRRDVDFLAININNIEEETRVRENISEYGLRSLRHVFSGNDVADEAFLVFGADQVPYFAVLDRRGRLVYAGGDEDHVYDLLNSR